LRDCKEKFSEMLKALQRGGVLSEISVYNLTGRITLTITITIMASTVEKPRVKHYIMPPFYRSSADWINARLTDIASIVRERLVLNLDQRFSIQTTLRPVFLTKKFPRPAIENLKK